MERGRKIFRYSQQTDKNSNVRRYLYKKSEVNKHSGKYKASRVNSKNRSDENLKRSEHEKHRREVRFQFGRSEDEQTKKRTSAGVKKMKVHGSTRSICNKSTKQTSSETTGSSSKKNVSKTADDNKDFILDVVKSVHKERFELYKPIIAQLAERHYHMLKQALSVGINPYEQTRAALTQQIESHPRNSYPSAGGEGAAARKTVNSYPDDSFLGVYRNTFCTEDFDEILDTLYKREGANYIKDNLDRASQQEISIIFYLCSSNYFSLSCSYYGNYVVQKVLDLCTPAERSQFFYKVLPDIKTISTNCHGTRVVQLLLSYCDRMRLLLVMDSICNNMTSFCMNDYACHIVLRISEKLAYLGPVILSMFLDRLIQNLDAIVDDVSGVKVVLQTLYICPETQKDALKEELLNRIRGNPDFLLRSTSCAIAQELYENGSSEEKNIIFQECLKVTTKLSCQPWSSRLLNSIFLNSSPESMTLLMSELLQPHKLLHMIRKEAGNLTLRKVVAMVSTRELVNIYIMLKQMKNPLPEVFCDEFKADFQSELRDQNVIEIARDFLISGKDFPENVQVLLEQFGIGLNTAKNWILNIFKGESMLLNTDNSVLLVLCIQQISTNKGNTRVLMRSLEDFIDKIISSFLPSGA